MSFAERGSYGHVALDPRPYELRQAISIVVEMVGKETQLDAERLRLTDLLPGDERVVLQTMSVAGPRLLLKDRRYSIEYDLNRPFALRVNRNVIARTMIATQLFGERLGLIVERAHVSGLEMQLLPRELGVFVGFGKRRP